MNTPLVVIGRRENVYLPELSSSPIEAKVDTGAFRSAIHCTHCEEFQEDGKTVLRAVFDLDGTGPREMLFERFILRVIKNSFGQKESRYCVRLLIRIGRKNIWSDVSLSDRSGMKYQVLLGRKTLGRKFVVDISRTHVLRAAKTI